MSGDTLPALQSRKSWFVALWDAVPRGTDQRDFHAPDGFSLAYLEPGVVGEAWAWAWAAARAAEVDSQEARVPGLGQSSGRAEWESGEPIPSNGGGCLARPARALQGRALATRGFPPRALRCPRPTCLGTCWGLPSGDSSPAVLGRWKRVWVYARSGSSEGFKNNKMKTLGSGGQAQLRARLPPPPPPFFFFFSEAN